MAVKSQDDVGQQADAQQPPGFLKFLSDVPVGGAGRWVSAQMTVRDGDVRNSGDDGRFQDFVRPYCAAVHVPAVYHSVAYQPVPC